MVPDLRKVPVILDIFKQWCLNGKSSLSFTLACFVYNQISEKNATTLGTEMCRDGTAL